MYGLFNICAFAIVEHIIVNEQILYCVIGFDIIQALSSSTIAVISNI